MKTLAIILEYCGGAQTDALFENLQSWNLDREIHVLDNASPRNRCSHISFQNPENTGIGGGIVDCFRLAAERCCDSLMLIANDIIPLSSIVIDQFEETLSRSPNLVQLSAAVSPDSSPQGTVYPWMVAQNSQNIRPAPHSDLLCCIVRCSFIHSFGGFVSSRGGWGYDWEIAYRALHQGKQIAIADWCVVRHEDRLSVDERIIRYGELLDVYATRYPKNEFFIENTVSEYQKRTLSGP
jgi:hypothetical protein